MTGAAEPGGAVTPAAALAALRALADPERAAGMAAYHKVARIYLGVSVPEIDRLAREWRAGTAPEERIALARALWASDVHEARVAAARLFDEARIRPGDGEVWRLIASWVGDFDAWAIADHVCAAGARRLVADPSRVGEVEGWTRSPRLWTRRAALVITLPWARLKDPGPADRAIRDQVLDWCAAMAGDPEWFIQKAVAWWLRELSRRDPARVRGWLAQHGAALRPWARREAGRLLALPGQPPGA